MKLELDHMFIMVQPEARVADALLELGIIEGKRNVHDGQGTSNRRFYFSNGMLEFLWLHDKDEALNGPGCDLKFTARDEDVTASPFGVILCRTDNTEKRMPFDGWKYQPDYFKPPMAFHVGENSENIKEPLCIYVPFFEPKVRVNSAATGVFKSITAVSITIPSKTMSAVMVVANAADRLSIEQGDEHLMEITFDDNRSGNSKDLRPAIPLVVHW